MNWTKLSRPKLLSQIQEAWQVYRWIRRQYRTKLYIENRQHYWESEHRRFPSGLKSVGPSWTNEDENLATYEHSRQVLIDFLKSLSLQLKDKDILEVGFGTGYFTQLMDEYEPRLLHGIDIAESAVKKITSQPIAKKEGRTFWHADIITNFSSSNRYDLIVMLDVTQHIPLQDLLLAGLNNVKTHLKETGTFLLTSYLNQPPGLSQGDFHVTYWNRAVYETIYDPTLFDYTIYPQPFNSKQLFAIYSKTGKHNLHKEMDLESRNR